LSLRFDYCCHGIFCYFSHIIQHWNYNLKPKMTLDKLQLIAIVVVLAKCHCGCTFQNAMAFMVEF
jgi:hypothetical protein